MVIGCVLRTVECKMFKINHMLYLYNRQNKRILLDCQIFYKVSPSNYIINIEGRIAIIVYHSSKGPRVFEAILTYGDKKLFLLVYSMPGECAEGTVGGVLELVLDGAAPRVERGYVLTIPRQTCTAMIEC